MFRCIYFGMHPQCKDFFKQVQTDWDETNEFSPSFLRNKPNVGITVNDITGLLENYLKISIWDLFQNNVVNVLLADYKFRTGVNEVTTLSGLPVTKASVVATLSGNSTLSLSGAMEPGQDINVHVIATSSLKVTLPSSSGWTLMDDTSLDLESGGVAEINVWCTGTGLYSVKTIVR